MVKTSRKNKVSRKNSSKKNKKSKKNGKQYSRKNKINKMKGGINLPRFNDFVERIKRNDDSLTEFNIKECKDYDKNTFFSDRLRILISAFENNTKLKSLDISDIPSAFILMINNLAEALKKNETLTNLEIRNNFINDDSAKILAEALKENETLTTLDIKYNNIGIKGATALAEALKKNKTLITLKINFNNIGDDGATALSEALKTNETLTILDIKDNNIGIIGATALAEALESNKNSAITELSLFNYPLENNDLYIEQKNRINVIIEKNKSKFTIKNVTKTSSHI